MTIEEPVIIQFSNRDISFPKICPVCGDQATTTGYIISAGPIGGGIFYGVRNWVEPVFQRKTSQNESDSEIVQLNIPVCREHYSSSADRKTTKSIISLIGLAALFALILDSVSIIWAFLFGGIIYDSYILGFITSLIILIVAQYLTRKSRLEQSVKIIHNRDTSIVLSLYIKHDWYAEELLVLNTNATIVE